MDAATAAARLEAKYCSSEKLALLLSLKLNEIGCVWKMELHYKHKSWMHDNNKMKLSVQQKSFLAAVAE